MGGVVKARLYDGGGGRWGVRVLAVRAVLRSVVKRSLPAPCASISFVLGISASVRGHGDSRWTYGGYVRVRLEVAGTCGAVLIRGRIVRIDDRGACRGVHGGAPGDTVHREANVRGSREAGFKSRALQVWGWMCQP